MVPYRYVSVSSGTAVDSSDGSCLVGVKNNGAKKKEKEGVEEGRREKREKRGEKGEPRGYILEVAKLSN